MHSVLYNLSKTLLPDGCVPYQLSRIYCVTGPARVWRKPKSCVQQTRLLQLEYLSRLTMPILVKFYYLFEGNF